MRILVAQINPIIGDLAGNTERIIQAIQRGRSQDVDLVILPELALSGYPPEDFILLPHFMEAVDQRLQEIAQATDGIAAIVGLPRYNPYKLEKTLYNSAALIQNRELTGFVDKILLPTYDVFDERRYFEPGERVRTWTVNGQKIGITICEDLWQHSGFLTSTSYRRDPVLELKTQQCSFLVNISASPYSLDKFRTRLEVCLSAARSLNCPVILCNQVGGNDSLIFDGYSLYTNPSGLLQCAKGFAEDDMLIDLSKPTNPIQVERNPIEDLYRALVLGVRDYFKKLGFQKACLGLSGGIDSAVVACIAAEALGPQNVLAVSMPSRYSSPESSRDAALLARRLGIEYREISIEPPFESYLSILAPSFEGKAPDITEENLQARIRGMLLMAFSNKFGYLVLSTGNKSELALGYSTLYGDMCGGLAVIGDVTKRQVYALAHWINRDREIIPLHTIERPPSAELRPNQKDSDSIPDYDIVDHVLQAYVEEHRSPQWIAGHFQYPLSLVQDLVKRIHYNEYKRRQAPPALRISEKAFSVGRRFPIVQRWI
jgi:NAD+ synthase (glutamine-hydrolysing)